MPVLQRPPAEDSNALCCLRWMVSLTRTTFIANQKYLESTFIHIRGCNRDFSKKVLNNSSSRHFVPFWITNKNRAYKKTPTATSEAMLRHGLASLFCREAEVLYGALKTKSCLSDSEFFLFSGIKCRSRQKSAALIFSFCYLFLLHQGKRKSKKHTPKKNIIINRKQKTFFFIFASLGVKKRRESSQTPNLH